MLSLALSQRNQLTSQIITNSGKFVHDKKVKEEKKKEIKKFKWSMLFFSAKYKSIE